MATIVPKRVSDYNTTLPHHYHINKRMVGFWANLVESGNMKISGILLQCLMKRDSVNFGHFSPWYSFVHQLFDKAGMSYVLHSYDNICPKFVKKSFNLRSKDICLQDWHSAVQNSTKCKIYQIIDKELKFEEYLSMLPWCIASPLCKLRTSNHRFPIETGRYSNIQRENRMCVKCDTGEVGDELHYMLSCDKFSTERSKYLVNHNGESKENIAKKLLLTKDKSELIKLGKFLQVILRDF